MSYFCAGAPKKNADTKEEFFGKGNIHPAFQKGREWGGGGFAFCCFVFRCRTKGICPPLQILSSVILYVAAVTKHSHPEQYWKDYGTQSRSPRGDHSGAKGLLEILRNWDRVARADGGEKERAEKQSPKNTGGWEQKPNKQNFQIQGGEYIFFICIFLSGRFRDPDI